MTPRCQRRGGRASSLPSHSQVLEVEKRRGERDERAIERDREVGGAEAGVSSWGAAVRAVRGARMVGECLRTKATSVSVTSGFWLVVYWDFAAETNGFAANFSKKKLT